LSDDVLFAEDELTLVVVVAGLMVKLSVCVLLDPV
jgi:hypothetical protein